MKKMALLTIPLLFLAGCSTVTITQENNGKLTSEPSYKASMPYYFWGLAGEHFVNVDDICGDGNAQQMQSQHTFGDQAISLLTLGIYSPRTAKVWCKEGV